MKHDIFTEAARKLVKLQINAGKLEPLIIQTQVLLQEARKYQSNITANDLRETVDRYIKEKAITYSDGVFLTFDLRFIDNIR